MFDLLRDGDARPADLPLLERRQAPRGACSRHTPFPDRTLRISEQIADSGRALHARAQHEGWEGLLVKLARSPYRTGKRSPEWRKLKLKKQDEFVVGGWTDPQGTREHVSARSILGQRVDDDPAGLACTSATSAPGFTDAEIDAADGACWSRSADGPTLSRRCRPRWRGACIGCEPRLAAQVRYTEMTDEGRLRHPAYLG